MSKYSITHTQNTVYLDKSGKAVRGYSITVFLDSYNEELTIEVPSLDPKVVETKVAELIKQRDALASMGQ